MNNQPKLATLESDLAAALERFEQAQRDEEQASRRRCDAQNALNAVQKKLDARVAELREEAPANSDWGHARKRPIRA